MHELLFFIKVSLIYQKKLRLSIENVIKPIHIHGTNQINVYDE